MRDCVAQAVETGLRIDAGDLDRRELEQGLQRDLEQLVRDEAASKSPFVPRDLEVSFRSFELEPGVVVSGKIDRIDRDPMGARGIVVDYKSGAASSASDIREQGPAPAAALHARPPRPARARARRRASTCRSAAVAARAGCSAQARTRSPASARATTSSRTSSTKRSTTARSTAVGLVERIRDGDVRHDPHGGDCPHWCDLWRMCRKERP